MFNIKWGAVLTRVFELPINLNKYVYICARILDKRRVKVHRILSVILRNGFRLLICEYKCICMYR